MNKSHRFGQEDYRVESKETLFQGFFRITRTVVTHRLFGGGWSAPLKRELFQRGDAVGVLLYDPKNHLIGLVEQFRIGAQRDRFGPWQYEVVAGMIDAGQTASEVALKECHEEAGLAVQELVPICDYLVSAGGTDEKMHLYCGLVDLRDRAGIFGLDTEGEDILLQVWTYDEVMQAQSEGLLNSAAVTIALLWLQLNSQKVTNMS
ncbi:MAG: NUDIX domain-containing protein [Porticoccaceae bacterium]|jgi:ADP-ribose pyrophosphatase|tara:strand:+ start:2298 stop:2912 length:615 start_codon:yes stop_codon:yes gene_type:complete